MEQTVWLYVGIIGGLIGLGFVISIIATGGESSKTQSVESALRVIQQNNDFVCGSEYDTMYSVPVQLVAGMDLYSRDRAICADYLGEKTCKQTGCSIFGASGGDFNLSLSSPEAMQLFEVHSYTCYTTRIPDGVLLECKG